ncbi:hypothetical protein BGM09_10375 [Streptomyces sp. CBMA29]|nr:hypothetical protein [Streptomyces sp. CBMA29]
MHTFLCKSPGTVRVEGSARSNLAAGSPSLCYYAPVGSTAHSYASDPAMAVVDASAGGVVDGVKAPVAGRYKLAISGSIAAVTAQAAARVCYLMAAVNTAATGTAVAAGAFVTVPLTNWSSIVHSGAKATEVVLNAGDIVRVACRMDGSAYNWASGNDAGYTLGSFIELRWIGEVPT